MNTVNASTGFSPFQLHLGCSPWMLPPLVEDSHTTNEPKHQHTLRVIAQLQLNIIEAQDNLLLSKVAQATSVNKHWTPLLVLQVRDHVMLTTKHHHREYIQKGDKQVAK
ncbi:hypothetical protein BDR04DRAFT_968447, partial [Suillus decipiens]